MEELIKGNPVMVRKDDGSWVEGPEIITLKGCKIIFKNFEGRPTKFKAEGGYRSFNVVIEDPENIEYMTNAGWNIRILRPREEGEEPSHVMEVAVSWKNKRYEPDIVAYSGDSKVHYDEESVSNLDFVRILSADVTIRPHVWNEAGDIKAYVSELYMDIEDEYRPLRRERE